MPILFPSREMLKFAQLVSETFNPLSIAALSFFLLVMTSSGLSWLARPFVYLVALIFSSGLIFLYLTYLRHKGVIKESDVPNREQRISPLTFAILSYAAGYILLTIFRVPELIKGLMFCYATNTLVILAITRHWKISIHTAAVAGALVALTYHFGVSVLPFYLLIPLVGVSRVKMQRHDYAEVIAGSLVGLVLTALQIQMFFLR